MFPLGFGVSELIPWGWQVDFGTSGEGEMVEKTEAANLWWPRKQKMMVLLMFLGFSCFFVLFVFWF